MTSRGPPDQGLSRACDRALEAQQRQTGRRSGPPLPSPEAAVTSHMCSWKTRRSLCVSWATSPGFPPVTLARSLSFSSLVLGAEEREV